MIEVEITVQIDSDRFIFTRDGYSSPGRESAINVEKAQSLLLEAYQQTKKALESQR